MARIARASLSRYKKKRNFAETAEPAGRVGKSGAELRYVVQRHDARRLHYDFRLELDGVLKSWAVPKGPSLVVGEKRLAVEVEDHPLDYGSFEGAIPQGHYGAGNVLIWDEGTWRPRSEPHEGLRKGKLSFELSGKRLNGAFALVRLRGTEKKPQWLLLKEHDAFEAQPEEKSVTAGAAPPPLKTFSPELATLEDAVPAGDGWVVEPKLDGYRALTRLEKGHAELMSRNGKVWTDRYAAVVAALERLPIESAVFDGEICAVGDDGIPRFQLLQNAEPGRARKKTSTNAGGEGRLVYFLFDLLFLDGEDLRQRPLETRKAMLESVLAKQEPPLVYVTHVPGSKGAALFRAACERGTEGVVAKRLDAPYRPVRSLDWVKVKCKKRQEVVVVGFTAPGGSREGLGALLLAVNDDDGALRYAGKVGTGFDARTLADLARRLKPLATKNAPVTGAPKARDVTWVRPKLVAEVEFTEWTTDGALRHPAFVGLREDKSPEEVKREVPVRAPRRKVGSPEEAKGEVPVRAPRRNVRRSESRAGRSAGAPQEAQEATVRGVRISHPDRVIDRTTGVTKLELAEYYGAVADLVLPFVKGRPLALVRCPEGDQAECFFQKQRTPGMPDSIREERVGKNRVLHVEDIEGLVSLIQFGAVELHLWGSKLADVHRPDWIVMDLDPSPELEFARTAGAAEAVRDVLKSLGLASFPKTTGGKGIHVVAPIEPEFDFDDVKELTHAVAERLAHDDPKFYTAVMSKKSRTGKIFVDYLRNGEGATAIAPYAVRARPGNPVAMPVAWSDLEKIAPSDFTVRTVPDHLKGRRRDPWESFFTVEQHVPAALAKTRRSRRAG